MKCFKSRFYCKRKVFYS